MPNEQQLTADDARAVLAADVAEREQRCLAAVNAALQQAGATHNCDIALMPLYTVNNQVPQQLVVRIYFSADGGATWTTDGNISARLIVRARP